MLPLFCESTDEERRLSPRFLQNAGREAKCRIGRAGGRRRLRRTGRRPMWKINVDPGSGGYTKRTIVDETHRRAARWRNLPRQGRSRWQCCRWREHWRNEVKSALSSERSEVPSVVGGPGGDHVEDQRRSRLGRLHYAYTDLLTNFGGSAPTTYQAQVLSRWRGYRSIFQLTQVVTLVTDGTAINPVSCTGWIYPSLMSQALLSPAASNP